MYDITVSICVLDSLFRFNATTGSIIIILHCRQIYLCPWENQSLNITKVAQERHSSYRAELRVSIDTIYSVRAELQSVAFWIGLALLNELGQSQRLLIAYSVTTMPRKCNLHFLGTVVTV